MPISTDKTILGPWAAEQCRMVWTPMNSSCIGLIGHEGTPTAAAWFQDYSGASIMAHIAVSGNLTPRFVAAIFDYPFRQLDVKQIVCPVVEDNTKSLSLVHHFGFKPVGRIPSWARGGDMIFFAMQREGCKWLKGRYGQRLGITS